MKVNRLALAILLAAGTAAAADYIRFAERLSDAVFCYVDEGEKFCEIYARDPGGFTARLTLPGAESVPFAPGTPITINIGELSFSADLGDADILTNNRAAFAFTQVNNQGKEVRVGGLILSRASNVVTIAAAWLYLPVSIVAEWGNWDDQGKGETTFILDLGGVHYQRQVYFKAAVSQRPPPTPDDDPLRTIIALGKADFTRPTVIVAQPKNRARTSSDMITLQGTAKDNVGVQAVWFRVGSGVWSPATGTTNWNANVTLAPGTNVIQVVSIDLDILQSRVVSRTVIRSP